jgi:aminomethyltransferase
MPIQSPFHPRTSALCTSMLWKDWAGYYAVCSYDTCHEREYHSFRQAAGLIDVTPLYKYEVRGPDATRLLSLVMVRNIRKLKVGRVTYLCWCDDDGKVVDDGTVSRLDEDHYRVTAAEPAMAWMQHQARGLRVTIEDSTAQVAALALQGPRSREILGQIAETDLGSLKFFAVVRTAMDGAPVWISRTGYTGDLGYEIWVEREHALKVWDAVMEAGRPHRILPAGLDALDVTRVEAGFIMNGVDYFSSNHCLIDSRKSTPYEINLGWTVNLDREPFVGQAALTAEKQRGPAWTFVGLVYDWDEYEALFDEFNLPPQVPAGAWRSPVPVYDTRGRQIGRATSGAWSPILKKNLALASIQSAWAAPGTRLKIEVTAEYERRQVSVTVAKVPFFNPERKRA